MLDPPQVLVGLFFSCLSVVHQRLVWAYQVTISVGMENIKENNEKNLSQHSLRMMRKAFVFKQQVKKIFFQDSFGLGKKF